jgi:CheY-like chemotaxis protein
MDTLKGVLVVEDQEWPMMAIKDAMREAFTALDLTPEITYVTNFEAASAAIESEQKFDLVLLDHRMPRIDLGDLEDTDFDAFSRSLENIGYSLIPKIRELQPQSTIIGTSSMSSELRNYPHKPDQIINKSQMSEPEKEFLPLLRRLIELPE